MTGTAGKGWEDLSQDDRDLFLLAAVGGQEEWRLVMTRIGLDGHAADKVASAICPMAWPPRSADDRDGRERAALRFQGNRPLGLAFRDALARRDASLAVAAFGPAAAAAISTPDPEAGLAPPPRMPRLSSQRPGWLQAIIGALGREVGNIRQAIAIVLADRLRHRLGQRPPLGGSSKTVFDIGSAIDDGDVGENLKVLEAARERWLGMGSALRDMTVASALRGYPPAIAFVRLVAPHVRPGDCPTDPQAYRRWEAESIRHRRMIKALERDRSSLFRLYRRLHPPIG